MSVDRILRRYPKMVFGTYGTCSYCGSDSNHRDHVIPVSYMSSRDSSVRRFFDLGPQTHACGLCNARINDRTFNSFQDRVEWICQRNIEKSKKASADWADKELNELNGSLKEFVLSRVAVAEFFRKKTYWPFTKSYYQNIENLLYDSLLDPSHPRFLEQYYEYFRTTIEGINSSVYSRTNGQGS